MNRFPLAIFALCLAVLVPMVASAQPGPRTPCRTDRYFIHVPTSSQMANLPNGQFGPALANALAIRYAQLRRPPRFAIESIERVLRPRRRVDERADGHRRFWQVRLDRRLALGASCRFVEALREEAEALLSGARLYVGRECVATGMSNPDPFASDWHLEQVGQAPPLPLGDTPASVAVIDTGFDLVPAFVADPAWSPNLHRHGAAMVDLIHQIDPTVPVADYRALDEDGQGDLADVAKAVDQAVFDAVGPAVLSMSLGWPPELERARTFEAGACSTTEDPAGEAVRYALLMAHLRDTDALHVGGAPRARNGATAVVAAIGNRARTYSGDPTVNYQKLLDVDMQAPPPVGECALPGSDDLFYPAQWSRRPTCLDKGGLNFTYTSSIIAVGAVDHRGLASPLNPPVSPPSLMAPGVYVEAAGRRWSGSSVSAALVAAEVARRLGAGAVDASEAEQQIFGDGVALTSIDPNGSVRQLAYADPYVAGPPVGPVAPGQLVDGSQMETWSSLAVGACLVALDTWTNANGPFQDVLDDCPEFLHVLDRFSAAGAGPAPPTSGCPDCVGGLLISQGGDEVELYVELTSDWDPATVITKPFLYAEWPDGAFVWLPLPDNGEWIPGAQFTVKSLNVAHPQGTLGLSDLHAGGKMQLELQVQTPKQDDPTTDVSVVTMKAW